jgi:hypothetical protein
MNRSDGDLLPGVVVVVVVVVVLVTVVVEDVTVADAFDPTVVAPPEVCAVTRARNRRPTSALRTPYVWPVAPAMLTHPVTSVAHRCHCREYDDGAGVQLPFDTVSVSPTRGEPVTAGFTVFVGPFFDPMTSVGADVADALPSVFAAVTTTRSVWSTSPDVGTYVLVVPLVMSPQPVPSDAHRCHW